MYVCTYSMYLYDLYGHASASITPAKLANSGRDFFVDEFTNTVLCRSCMQPSILPVLLIRHNSPSPLL